MRRYCDQHARAEGHGRDGRPRSRARLSAEIIARVFEPYVTTKARGTGLGLAIVKKIVDEHHGGIRINNRQPVGAEVSILLPLAPCRPASDAQAQLPSET
jgi:light-regulated signal transduction histidine kinase (bacteriophytochrome)